ncbi:MAG: carbamoyltransferase [Bacteriovoracia bacterium]
MVILGIHGGFTLGQHDAGAALIKDGKVIAVCEEERFLKIKAARGQMPIFAINACLKEAGLKMKDVDLVLCPGATYEKMEERLGLFFKHYFHHQPKIQLVNHQLAHLASTYYASGYSEAMCVSYDFRGDRLSCALGVGKGDTIEVLETYEAENSLGMFYAMITQHMGFSIGEDEYKLMGLAPYGEDKYDLSPILKITDQGYEVNMDFVRKSPPISSSVEPIYSEKLNELLGAPRLPSEPITQRHKDIAHSAQKHLEKALNHLITKFYERTKIANLCVAGGVALNCSANGKIRALPFLKKMFVQPASSDRGLPLGCAYIGSMQTGHRPEVLTSVYMGPTYTDEEVKNALTLTGLTFKKSENTAQEAAGLLAKGKVIGWFQGRSEFGPRALGNRSILADPRAPHMKDVVNKKIKFREEFRPFAPACLEEAGQEIFDLSAPSPFMTYAVQVRDGYKSQVASTTHVDNSARVQTVSAKTNPRFHALISEFNKITGTPVVLNTSFNVKGQPIVETALDAVATFASTGIDALFVHDYVLYKS